MQGAVKKRRSQWVLQLRFQQVPGSISHTQLPLLSSGPLSPGQAEGPVGSSGGREVPFFFSYHGFWIWTRERLGSRGRRRRVEELRRDQGPIHFCLLEEPVDLRLIHPSTSSPRELLSEDFEKILLGISKALRGSGGPCVSSCGKAPLGPIRCENPMVSISAGALD